MFWPLDKLKAYFEKYPQTKQKMTNIFALDLIRKLSTSNERMQQLAMKSLRDYSLHQRAHSSSKGRRISLGLSVHRMPSDSGSGLELINLELGHKEEHDIAKTE